MFNYNECAVCLNIKYLCKTNCNHYFCLGCIIRVDKCPLCRKNFTFPELFKELKKYFIEKENKRLSEIKDLFDILPNYIEQNNNNIEFVQSSYSHSNLNIDYIYLDSEERRRFAQSSHEYLIDQINFTSSIPVYIPLSQTNINLL